MPSDHEIALSFLARRQASRSMTAARWSHLLSLDLGWMNPGQARAFVDGAVRAGILAPDGDHLRLVIDPTVVEVPRGFRPKADAAATPPTPRPPEAKGPPGAASPTPSPSPPPPVAQGADDPFLLWLSKLAVHRGTTRDQVLGQVAALQESMGGLLTAEAAVLLLARRNGLDVAADAARAAQAMLNPSGAGAGGAARAREGTR